MTAKIKIDLSQGIIEAEGSEEFLKEIYADFREKMVSAKTVSTPKIEPDTHHTPGAVKPVTKPEKAKTGKNSRSKVGKDTVSIVKDLDLAKQENILSLQEFFQQYKTTNSYHNNLIFVYYLQNIREVEGITVNHIFTCYRNLGIKSPKRLKQSLYDMSHRNGWIDTSSIDDIKLAIPGINFLEHDLPKA